MKLSTLDLCVLLATLGGIVLYGVFKNRSHDSVNSYLRGGQTAPWYVVCLSVMATQASAITFLSTPGQGYDDGLRFVQFYFGMPIAVLVVAYVIAPKYIGLNVYTAYEFLESRFDLKTRQLTALLFLVQRGFAAGLTIYAPSIVFSSVLGWSLDLTIVLIGASVTLYTLVGGTKAVNQTQLQQMTVIAVGMVSAFCFVIALLPEEVNFQQAVDIATLFNKTQVLDTSFDFSSRYTLWSGLTGGFFLALSYFGTDQSQVQRYLSGSSLKQSRTGLLANGVIKIPMQASILFLGAMLFVFYQFEKPPAFFNQVELNFVRQGEGGEKIRKLEKKYGTVFEEKKALLLERIEASRPTKELDSRLRSLATQERDIRTRVKETIAVYRPDAETEDTDYIFITFIVKYLPAGLIGLLLAVFTSAAMSSTAGELNALASTSIIDFYKRSLRSDGSESHYVLASKLATLGWGLLAVAFASVASLFDNLIEAVNIVGSLFYGTILGVFLMAFFSRKISGTQVFISAIFAELIVIACYYSFDIGFLWFNVLGCAAVAIISCGLLARQLMSGERV